MTTQTDLTGRDEAFSILESALKGSAADQTELVLLRDRTDLTRYANSEIHQSVSEVDLRVAIRVALGRATVRLFVNTLDGAAIRRGIEDAISLARLQAPNPRFQSLPTPAMGYPAAAGAPQSYFESSANLSPEARAETIGQIIDAASSEGFTAFGTYSVSASELAVVSDTGIRAYTSFTRAYLKALVEGPGGTGFSDALDRDASRIDAGRVAAQAVEKCRANHDQQEIEPGDYPAIFEPNAVADMVRFPVTTGMGAREVLDGQSFMAGHLGEKVAGSVVSIWDDPLDARCMPLAIDYEGLPAQRVDVVNEGVAVAPVYDTQTAQEAGTRSTGHASSPWGSFVGGPEANHIVMRAGQASIEGMISHIDRGVLVTRFHYTHCPDPRRVIATGTTRDGTFLIREGKIAAALKNLRLEMPVLDLLSSLQEAGEGKQCQDWWAANGMSPTNYFVPSMRFGACRFTGVTTF